MALLSFNTFRESSPATRNKAAAANGLQPMYSADVFGHSTPPPAVAEKLLKKLDADKPKKKKKKKDDDLPVSENKGQKPDYSFDNFVKKAASTAKEIDKDIEDGKKKEAELDTKKDVKDVKDKTKAKTSVPAKKAIPTIAPFPFISKGKEEIPGETLPSKEDDDAPDERDTDNDDDE